MQDLIEAFLEEGPWAVVGASTDRSKYGNKVFRCYLQNDKQPVWPVHPTAAEVEGHTAYPRLADLPEVPRGLSIITPPQVTEKVIEEAATLGVPYVWMQPGAESAEAIARAESAGMGVIAHGPCVLVVLGYRE